MKKIFLLSVLTLLASTLSIAQTRVVLIEQFTNSGCPPCAASSPSIFNFVDSNPTDVGSIAYHTSFPYNDSMYFENPAESSARVSFYGVSGVPYSIVDGNYYKNSSSGFIPVMSSTIATRKAISPKYDAQTLSLNLVGNLLTGSLRFTSLNVSNATDNLVAYIVVIEKYVLKSSYAASPSANSETEYGYVMRKMFPNSSGTLLINKALSGNDTVNINWTLNKIKDINEMKVVVFVQNTITQEVYQAQLFTPTISSVGINDVSFTSISQATIYPNPSTGNISISVNKELFIDKIEILNQLGQVVYIASIKANTNNVSATLNLESGDLLCKNKW